MSSNCIDGLWVIIFRLGGCVSLIGDNQKIRVFNKTQAIKCVICGCPSKPTNRAILYYILKENATASILQSSDYEESDKFRVMSLEK